MREQQVSAALARRIEVLEALALENCEDEDDKVQTLLKAHLEAEREIESMSRRFASGASSSSGLERSRAMGSCGVVGGDCGEAGKEFGVLGGALSPDVQLP